MKVNTAVNKVNIYDHGLRKRAKASGEAGQVIAFGALGPDSHDARLDSEWLEPAGQPTQCGGRRAKLGVAASGTGAKCLQ